MPPKLTLTEAFLKESLAENRRLRGEVRRYRRVIREAESELSVSPYPCDQRLRDKLYAALAPRRRTKP